MTQAVPEKLEGEESALAEGPGRRLRRAREAAEISIGEVSARLHLDIKTVRAIEADDYAKLPGPAFVRGYLRGYARMVNVPIEPLVELFNVHGLASPTLVADISERPQTKSSDFPVQIFTWLIVVGLAVLVFLWWRGQVFSSDPAATAEQSAQPGADSGAGTAAPANDPSATPATTGAQDAPSRRSGQSRFNVRTADDAAGTNAQAIDEPATVAGRTSQPAALSNTIPAAALAPGSRPASPAAATANPVGADVSAQGSIAAGTLGSTVPAAGAAIGSESASAQTGGGSSASGGQASVQSVAGSALAGQAGIGTTDGTSSAATTPATVADGGGAAPNAQSSGGTAAPASGAPDKLSLSFRHEAWVEVYDRNGQKLYWNLVRPGQNLNLTGQSPMRVVLGKIDKVEVTFNQKPVDFAAYTSRGVARFILDASGISAMPDGPAADSTGSATN